MNWAFTSSGNVTETYAAGLLRKMLEIPSSSYQERALADYLAEAMTDLGFQAQIDGVGNVIGVIERGDGPTVMLLGHMDTVSGRLPVHSEDGRLYGRGAVDAKGPLAAMICAAAGAVDFPGRIVVVGVVEEETPRSRGAMAIRATHAPPDALIIGEPSGWSSVVLGYKGKLDLRYTVKCPATHPSNPVPKASELAVACWDALVELLGPDASHGVFDQPGATLTQLNADLTSATADLSIRIPPGFDVDGLVSALRDRLPAGNLEVLNSVAACRVGRGDPAVRALVVRCPAAARPATPGGEDGHLGHEHTRRGLGHPDGDLRSGRQQPRSRRRRAHRAVGLHAWHRRAVHRPLGVGAPARALGRPGE